MRYDDHEDHGPEDVRKQKEHGMNGPRPDAEDPAHMRWVVRFDPPSVAPSHLGRKLEIERCERVRAGPRTTNCGIRNRRSEVQKDVDVDAG